MGSWPVSRIPHVVDEMVFTPMPRSEARAHFCLGRDTAVITFLASAGVTDHRKGFDFLQAALPAVVTAVGPVTVLVVGPRETVEVPAGVAIACTGPLGSDEELRRAYCAADVVVVPSREDNMPLTAMEAQTCGRAVVSFEIGGLPDIVEHHSTGYLAAPGDTSGLADGIAQAIEDSRGHGRWGRAARERALATWSTDPVVSAYLALYKSRG
jgi:glycosyltransferase involved in cell wall biosynthesis